ncbi:uncharacterized protein LOC124413666 [Diprion similis]|uniref:uncharacterized protein LOC124413666 n=1 Tax=Diprion similis TaxID=362088 RepID=UPI001EF8C7B4|nr:uncharacterized protein LOC124413666 [Diprion similis]
MIIAALTVAGPQQLWLTASGPMVFNYRQTDDVSVYATPVQSAISLKIAEATIQSLCLVPPQPSNGHWKLHRKFCDDHYKDCDVPQHLRVNPNTQLVYTCNANYEVRGPTDVFCDRRGLWSDIPECVEIKCSALNSRSTRADCSLHGQLVSCDSAVSSGVEAKLFCRQGYRKETSSSASRRDAVVCNSKGEWEPIPLRCVPACGVLPAHNGSFRSNGVASSVGGLPWHASLYKEDKTSTTAEKQYQCGATIIRPDLVMTAAHCVYDETLGYTENPDKLFLLAGSTSRSYDSPLHDPKIVRKAAVKNIHINCQYYGLLGNYRADIALLELKQPFELSDVLLPACLDFSNSLDLLLEPGVLGRVTSFGRITSGETGNVLQTLTVPYISYNQCKRSINAANKELFISTDEFCAGSTNGSAVCLGDSGGGLVFEQNHLWYVLGIVSIGFGVDTSSGEWTCDKNSYSRYTKVSNYVTWIQDVMFNLERNKSHPPCESHNSPPAASADPLVPSSVVTSNITQFACTCPISAEPWSQPQNQSNQGRVFCFAPLQPANGERRLRSNPCEDDKGCSISEGAALELGTALTYSCRPGFRMKGNPDVYCVLPGRWSAIPNCIEIMCPPLDDDSMFVTCYRSNHRTPCNSSALAYTTATLACRSAFIEDSSLGKAGRKTVTCNMNGEWEPNPITCVPVCGALNTKLTPTVVHGVAADIVQFPWHATLYRQETPSQATKEFQCGATIIKGNILLTAAHCVYDEYYQVIEKPEKFYVLTGNNFRDYDSPLNNEHLIRKAAVKSIYLPCEYHGREGNYNSDIAVIELREAFALSGILIPACMDIQGYTDRILKSRSVGRIAGFGKTRTGVTSATLLTTNIFYVPIKECKMADSIGDNAGLLTNDKFCGKSENGMGVGEGDSGGGLVFENDGKWYVMGILSANLGARTLDESGTRNCTAHSLYTEVSAHISWVLQVLFNLERYQYYPFTTILQTCRATAIDWNPVYNITIGFNKNFDELVIDPSNYRSAKVAPTWRWSSISVSTSVKN